MPRFAAADVRRTIRAAETIMRLAPVLDARGSGRRKRSLRAIAAELNAAGVPTRTGGRWWPEGVRRALAEAERAGSVLMAGG